MLGELDQLVDDASRLNSKLILVIGPAGKTTSITALSEGRGVPVLNVGLSLSKELVAVPRLRRHLQVGESLNQLAEASTREDLLLLDNIEILFDRDLRLNPLDLLKKLAHARRVVATWPGELRNGRLYYASSGHSEHRDYATDGLVQFRISSKGNRG